MSETCCILVLSGDPDLVSSTVAALRKAGRNALGTSDPWESILLVARRSFALIVEDGDLKDFGAIDFGAILNEDPELREVPRIRIAGRDDLLTAVENALNPRLPPEEPSRTDTRFVRRRRPSAVPSVV
jgi:hypothetical protein